MNVISASFMHSKIFIYLTQIGKESVLNIICIWKEYQREYQSYMYFPKEKIWILASMVKKYGITLCKIHSLISVPLPSFQLVSPSFIFFFSYWNLIWLVFIKVKHFRYWFRIFLHINYTLTAAVIICFQSFWIFFFIQKICF